MTTIEKIERIATLRGRKYMTPEMRAEDAGLLDELELSGDVVDVSRLGRSSFVIGFDFPEDKRVDYEQAYHAAWTKQMNS